VLSTLNRHSAILRILKETGLTFDQIAIEKDDPLPVLAKELSKRDIRDHQMLCCYDVNLGG
jgi:hypothetical protein